ncbi:MAG TPA: 4Fe-4S binding protein [Mycobacteriales bacterium]|nr:4Fe-4S binding protein [Mycobacteriales bacterium]
MALSYAITAACTGCGACLRTCPEHAIRPGDGWPLLVLAHRCTGCAECVEVCPADALVQIGLSWEDVR